MPRRFRFSGTPASVLLFPACGAVVNPPIYSKSLKIAIKGLRHPHKACMINWLGGATVKSLRAALKRYFLTGLLVITPIWGTVLILKTLFVSVDGILGPALSSWVMPGHYVLGLGILTLFLLIFSTGLLAATFIGAQVVKQWEEFLHRVPVVRGIYATLKSMMDILSFTERDTYKRVVLIEFPMEGHYCFAFVTGMTKGQVQEIAPGPLVNVYVPTSPNPTSGYFLLVPEKDVVPLDITVEEAMKMIVSGGLYSPSQPANRTAAAARPAEEAPRGVEVPIS